MLAGILAAPGGAAAQTPAAAPAPEPDVTALAKTTQNPVGDLVALPFQFNFNNGGDLGRQTLLNLNVQPVIPFRASDNWNMMARLILPVNSIPTTDTARASGFGDIQAQLYLTPKQPGRIIWGLGPVISLPTSTVAPAETGSWAVGPGGVIVWSDGPWVVGGLINQIWTFAHSAGHVEVNQFLAQPFVNYNFGEGWALSFAPVITANWVLDEKEWTVPLGLGITKTTVLGTRPMSLGLQYYANVTHPAGSAGNQVRFVVSFLFPKRRG
jgi:hypothetical protein